MTDTKTLIEEAKAIGNWQRHVTGPDGNGVEGPTLFARVVFALEAAEQRADALAAVVGKVREARANHPECEKHAGDDAVSCGWKSAVLDIDDALGAAPADALRERDAQVRAEALRQYRERLIGDQIATYGIVLPEVSGVVDDLNDQADRIEKEAGL